MIPGLGRSLGGGNGSRLQYSCLENPHGQKSLVGYRPWSYKELDMNEHLHRKEEEDILRVKARSLQASFSLVSSLQSGVAQP